MALSEAFGASGSLQRIFDLSQPLRPGMPVAAAQPPYSLTLARRYGDLVYADGVSTATELVVMSTHAGTHIDALGHASRSGIVFGGGPALPAREGGGGLASLGIENCPPLICRGVLLDVPRARGQDELEAGYEITAQDLVHTLEFESQRIDSGNAVLVRTGWARHWDDRQKYLNSEGGTPGVGAEAARWLADRRIAVTGSDTIAYEVLKPGPIALPVHGIFLVDVGIPIIEVMNLEELAQDRIYNFMFIAIPLRMVGATGSPVRPIAIT